MTFTVAPSPYLRAAYTSHIVIVRFLHEPESGAKCRAVGGCIGDGHCSYCGEPMRVARDRLEALLDRLVETDDKGAA